MRFLAIGVLTALLAGCESKAPPTLTGGKPVAHWIEAMQNPDVKIRKEAAFKLGNAGPRDPAILSALIAAMDDRDAGVRSEAIVAVVKFGTSAADAIPKLNALKSKDRDGKVRRYATKALEKIESGKESL